MAAMDITERLEMIAIGRHRDLTDIVCRDAIREIERLRGEVKRLTALRPQVVKREAERLLERR